MVRQPDMTKEYKWCAIDAEGDVGKAGLRGVAFYSDRVQDYVTDHDEIRNLLEWHAEGGYIFLAHNAQYDLPVIFWQLHIPMKAVYYNGRFNHGEWKYNGERKLCHLWDTLALSGGLSLRKLGSALGLQKYETPQRLLGADPSRYRWTCEYHNVGECERCYAIRDAEIVYRFLDSLSETLSAWGVHPHHRISGLAMAVWKVLDRPEKIQLKDFKMRKLARSAFHGGRVETFKLGHIAPIYTADVCSMYPSIMQGTPYPDPTAMVYLNMPSSDLVDWNREGVARVDITIPPMYVPPLPYVHKGFLKYPIGRFHGSYTFAEIRNALSLGGKLNKVYEVAFSRNTLYPFTNFVGTLWEMREAYEKAKDPRALFAKLLMNNLYGRMGMQEQLERRDIYPAEPNTRLREQPKSSWYTQEGELYLTYEREQGHGNDWTNVLWAAQTTAYARLRLCDLLRLQGQALVYCDTDSVFSTSPIVGMGEGLGSLRDQQQYSEGIIAAPKLYALRNLNGEWIARAKGVPQSLALKFLREGVATYTQPIKPFGQEQRKIKAGTWVEITKEKQRVPSRRYPVDPSALFLENGWSDTQPEVVGPVQ